MSKKALIILAWLLVALLTGLFAWRFNPPPPQICLDGACVNIH